VSLAIGAYPPNVKPMTGAAVSAGLVDAAAGLGSPPTTTDASAASRNSGASKAVSDFLAYANETPAQRMRDAILKSMGLTEDDLKRMSPEQRKAVEDTIREKIKNAAEEAAKKGKTGLVADVTA
jgi:hypothetical protein